MYNFTVSTKYKQMSCPSGATAYFLAVWMHTQGLRGLVLGRTQQSRDCPGVDEILQSALCDEIYMQVIMLLYFSAVSHVDVPRH